VNLLPAIAIFSAAVVFALGERRLAGSRRRRDRGWRVQSFYLGLASLLVALEPPLDDLADRLFWAHMVQHMLLQMVVPPLILLGAPWLQLWRVVPLAVRRRLAGSLVHSARLRLVSRILTRPSIAWLLFLEAIAVSHLPAIFDYALRHETFHQAEHAVFLALGLLFWSRAIDSPPFRARLQPAGAVLFFGAAIAAESLLALAIMGAHAPLYQPYATLQPRPEGLSALADQQFGGSFMFEPGSLPLLLAFVWSLKRWLAAAPSPEPTRAQPLR
jgi:putative membrane protein